MKHSEGMEDGQEGDREADLFLRIHDEMIERVKNSTVSILAYESGDRPRQHATGTLVRIGDHHFMITAGHALGEFKTAVRDYERRIGLYIDNGSGQPPVIVQGEFRATSPVATPSDDALDGPTDPFDVGFVKLDPTEVSGEFSAELVVVNHRRLVLLKNSAVCVNERTIHVEDIDLEDDQLPAREFFEIMDLALRRRFTFEEVMPNVELLEKNPGQVSTSGGKIQLDRLLERINQRIEFLYDRDHTIGHSYFMGVRTLDDLDKAFRTRVIPLLQEYFYGDWEKIQLVLGDLTDTTDADGRPKCHPNAIIRHIVQKASSVLGVADETYQDQRSYEVSEELSAASFIKIYGEV